MFGKIEDGVAEMERRERIWGREKVMYFRYCYC